MSEDLHELYQSIILDHNKHPRHYGALDDATHHAEGYNPLCGDKIDVYLTVDEEGRMQVRFECASCAICKASASMMMAALNGEGVDVYTSIRDQVRRILDLDTDLGMSKSDSDLYALSGVRKFPARLKCASLPWSTFEAALQQDAKVVEE